MKKNALSNNKTLHWVLDALLAVLLIYLCGGGMLSTHGKHPLHEWAGIAFIALFVFHLFINHKRIKGIWRSKRSANKAALVVSDVLLLVALITIAISSLSISRVVFVPLDIERVHELRIAHLMATAWILPLAGFHLGLRLKKISLHSNGAVIVAFLLVTAGAGSMAYLHYHERLFGLVTQGYIPDTLLITFYAALAFVFLGATCLGLFIKHALKK